MDEPQTPPESFSPYLISEKLQERLDNDFTYHAPKEGQADRYTKMRDKIKDLAYYSCENTPPGREQARALTALEDAMYSANAAIARGE